MAELGSILLRRGTTAERKAFVPLKGEIIYDTELKQVFVGDGETYGGKSVYNDQLIVDEDNNLRAGDNLAIIIDENGAAKSMRLPGGPADERPNPVEGGLRFNTKDKTIEVSEGNEWFFLNKQVINGDVTELYVSLDGHDDRRFGKQRGRSWGTAFRTINVAMREAEDIINANSETEAFVNAEQNIRTKQVLVHVASGIYEEHLPIRVPPNTSVFGAGQRRCIVRPKAGEKSQSPWAKLRFWRETDAYPDGYFGHHYLTDPRSEYSDPLDNTFIDIFLCNDTNWFHDFSTDNHQSFCFVLDPEGQILTKSPYPHTGASFAKSHYETYPYSVGFYGGIFADGFTGNQDFFVDTVETDGLSFIGTNFWRKPNMPTAFYADGTRYQALRVEAPDDAATVVTSLLSRNKKFIQEETISYVNKTYIFEYDKTKCRRDLNLILEAASFDPILGTNYLGRIAALSYLRPNSAYVLSDQLTQTIGGLNYAKGQSNNALTANTALQVANTSLWNEVIDVLNNGQDNVDALTFPETVNDPDKDRAKQAITNNITFIQEETITFITESIRDGIAPFTTDFNYDQAKCRRDVRFLLEGVIFDLLFEGNLASQGVAQSYWKGLQSQVLGQQEQHAAAFTFVKNIIGRILRNSILSDTEKRQLSVPQDVTLTTAVSDNLVARAENLIQLVTDVVENGTNYAPLVEYPNLTVYLNNQPPAFKQQFQDKITVRQTLVNQIPTIINDTINFIDTTYASFNYAEDVCRRDVGLIIDAMIHDLTYGGEAETVEAAVSYFETGSTVIADQEAETVDAINKARDVALAVVANTAFTATQTIVSQVIDDDSTPPESGTEARITELFKIITDCITNYRAFKDANDLILANLDFIQDETVSFVDATYPDFVYNRDLCRRDTGYIVTAIADDLFGGSRKSVEAGRRYHGAASNLGDPSVAIGEQLVETLAANNYAKELVRNILSNEAPDQTYQVFDGSTALSTQTFKSNVNVSNAIKDRADTLYDYVLDIMENGLEQGPQSLPKYKIQLADSTPLLSSLSGRELTMITAGNKSFVSTDWTQFGNLGYGVLARNNARCELVSIFTYYCGYTYKAESGSEIRSLNGSSSNGIYGLGAEGRNPFEVPVTATTVNETVFVATADSSISGDNAEGDLQIVFQNAVDFDGNPATLFNVMVAEVDHGGATGVVRYEIGNFNNNKLNIKGSAAGLTADIPDGNDITIRLLQEYEIDTSSDISDLLLGAALIYDNDPNTGYRILEVESVDSSVRFKIRAIPTLNHITASVPNAVSAGQNQITITPINYESDEIEGRRIAYKGTIYKVTDYTGSVLTLDKNLNDAIDAASQIRLSPAPGETGKIFTDFSIVKAGNHDMLDIGTGSYEDSNYPRELYGPPDRRAVQSQEVNEIAPGRVFFVTNDQDGNFRVGDYFRVNQGDGSVSFSASIALSNLDGLGFTRGVTINEFSADAEMTDVSDEAVPTEQAVVSYINRRLGQEEDGTTVGGNLIGAGVLMLDGSQTMTGDLDLGGNDISNLGTLNVTDIDVNNTDTDNLTVNTSTTITGDVGLTGDINITGNIIPTVDDTYDLGSPTRAFRDVYIGPGSLYVNNEQVLYNDADGKLTLESADDQDLVISTPGNGSITFKSTTEFDVDLTVLRNLQVNGDTTLEGDLLAPNLRVTDLTSEGLVIAGAFGRLITSDNITFLDDGSTTPTLTVSGTVDVDDITIDNVDINDNKITINGNEIYATGTAAAGEITLRPGFTSPAVGTVNVIGDLQVSGAVTTADVSLGATIIGGNFTAQSNVTLGDASTDAITFTGQINSDLVPYTDSTHDLGTSSKRWADALLDDFHSLGGTIQSGGSLQLQNSSATDTITLAGATGNITISGSLSANAITTQNLTVTGAILNELEINDNVVILNADFTGNPTENAGIRVERGNQPDVQLRWNESTDRWQITSDGTNYINIATTTDDSNSAVASASFATGTGVLTLTKGDASTVTVDLDGRYYNTTESDNRYVNVAGDTMTGELQLNARLDVGDGTGDNTEIRIRKADNNVSDHIQFYNGTTRIGEIGAQDNTWLRINQVTAKNIYTPRYIRADSGFFVDGATKGIDGSGNFVGGGTGTFGNVGVTGNISVSGTVDGRDVATDGTKLDGIETGATADQTANEILTAIKTVDGTGTGLDADLLDGYEASSLINGTHTSHSRTNAPVGWYTIATNTGNRAVARFGLRDTAGGRHQAVIFYASHMYGTNSSNVITVLHNSRYSTSPLRYIRIKDGGTYEGAALQVYIDNASNNLVAYMLGDNFQSSGWVLKDWIADATDPGDLDNYASMGVRSQIDLDQIDQGGMVTTGPIFAGGDTQQFRVLTTDDEGSGNGIDADTLDGQEGSYYRNASNLNAGTFPDLFSNSTRYNIGLIDGSNSQTRDKLRVWSTSDYTIGMKNSYTFGGLNNDYAMSFQMNNDNDRGFWWGDSAHTDAQGAASLTTNGKLTVAHSIRVGHGESDTTTPGATHRLDVNGSLIVQGTNNLVTRSITTGAATTTGTITGRWSLSTNSRFEATYADLAEVYTTDQEYEPGTIVMFGGEQEVTLAQGYATTKVAGVISHNYAFLMNQEAEGQPLALKGRIPVKVKGPVNKGDFIVVSNEPGVGVACDNYIGGAIVGKAVENKTTDEIDFIEVMV